MNIETLKQMTEHEVLNFIEKRLQFNDFFLHSLKYHKGSFDEKYYKEHKRFDMSPSQTGKSEATAYNMSIVNLFADLGIYDSTRLLFLDFYKGCGTLYLKSFCDKYYEYELSGYGSKDIILFILRKTISEEIGTKIK